MPTLSFPSFPILTTDRLVLREHLANDAPALYQMRSDDLVMQYVHRERPQAIEDIENLIALMNENYVQNKSLTWAISLKQAPDEMIGSIGYYRSNLENHRAEIGYMLSSRLWRQGLISEALTAVIDFGFEQIRLHSICAYIDPNNEASRQILLKHGFVKEAYHREDFYFNGKFMDTEIYGLLKGDRNGSVQAANSQ